jgi:hypothetical protein
MCQCGAKMLCRIDWYSSNIVILRWSTKPYTTSEKYTPTLAPSIFCSELESPVSFLIGVSLLFRVRRQKYSNKTEHLIMLISSLGTLDEFDISSGSGTKELNIVHIMV